MPDHHHYGEKHYVPPHRSAQFALPEGAYLMTSAYQWTEKDTAIQLRNNRILQTNFLNDKLSANTLNPKEFVMLAKEARESYLTDFVPPSLTAYLKIQLTAMLSFYYDVDEKALPKLVEACHEYCMRSEAIKSQLENYTQNEKLLDRNMPAKEMISQLKLIKQGRAQCVFDLLKGLDWSAMLKALPNPPEKRTCHEAPSLTLILGAAASGKGGVNRYALEKQKQSEKDSFNWSTDNYRGVTYGDDKPESGMFYVHSQDTAYYTTEVVHRILSESRLGVKKEPIPHVVLESLYASTTHQKMVDEWGVDKFNCYIAGLSDVKAALKRQMARADKTDGRLANTEDILKMHKNFSQNLLSVTPSSTPSYLLNTDQYPIQLSATIKPDKNGGTVEVEDSDHFFDFMVKSHINEKASAEGDLFGQKNNFRFTDIGRADAVLALLDDKAKSSVQKLVIKSDKNPLFIISKGPEGLEVSYENAPALVQNLKAEKSSTPNPGPLMSLIMSAKYGQADFRQKCRETGVSLLKKNLIKEIELSPVLGNQKNVNPSLLYQSNISRQGIKDKNNHQNNVKSSPKKKQR